MEREAIKEAVKEALSEELKAFYIDRETHYQHHQLIGNWSSTLNSCKRALITATSTIIIGAILGLMAIGFWAKGR